MDEPARRAAPSRACFRGCIGHCRARAWPGLLVARCSPSTRPAPPNLTPLHPTPRAYLSLSEMENHIYSPYNSCKWMATFACMNLPGLAPC
jgi:hypothetical protein